MSFDNDPDGNNWKGCSIVSVDGKIVWNNAYTPSKILNVPIPDYWAECLQSEVNPRSVGCKELPKEPNMTENEIARARLNDRAYAAQRDAYNKLETTFNLYVDNSPKTYKELIDAIKNDKFKLDEKRTRKIDSQDDDNDWYGDAFDGIIWDGPQSDYKGYEVAHQELKSAYEALKDKIAVLAPVDALAAFNEFQKWQPSNAPTTAQ